MRINTMFAVLALLACPFMAPSAQEAAASRDSFRSDVNAIANQVDAKTAAVTVVLNQLTVCNAKSRFYRPGVTGADAQGCVAPVAAPDPRLDAIAYCSERSRFYAPGTTGADSRGCVPSEVVAGKIAYCSARSKFYGPGTTGADANGCLTAAAGGITYVGSYGSGSATADFCTLSLVNFGTTSDNHGHTCTLGKSGRTYTLTETSVKGTTNCSMLCYNVK